MTLHRKMNRKQILMQLAFFAISFTLHRPRGRFSALCAKVGPTYACSNVEEGEFVCDYTVKSIVSTSRILNIIMLIILNLRECTQDTQNTNVYNI